MIVSFDDLRDSARRALTDGGAAPGTAAECGWACAWLQACGYKGLAMLLEALDETSPERRQPSLAIAMGGVDGGGVSAVFFAPALVELAVAHGRIVYRNTRHGLYALPFAVRAGIGIGCPVDLAFAIGGERSGDPYTDKLAAARDGIAVDDELWHRLREYSGGTLVSDGIDLLEDARAAGGDNGSADVR